MWEIPRLRFDENGRRLSDGGVGRKKDEWSGGDEIGGYQGRVGSRDEVGTKRGSVVSLREGLREG